MMITVLDRGDKKDSGVEPREVRMPAVDARHAIAADPERYSEVSRDVVRRKPGGLEDRLTAIEERLERLEARPAAAPLWHAPQAPQDATERDAE